MSHERTFADSVNAAPTVQLGAGGAPWLMSWIPNLDPYNPAVQFLYQITEPVLEPVRRLIPPLGGTIDISMIVVFFALMVLQRMLQTLAV
jgi:YggT family protein